MIGAIIGDIAGSRFEWDNYRAKDFDLLSDKCFFTDDSIMSLAVCDALLKTVPSYKGLSRQAVLSMQKIGRPYPQSGYGGSFYHWIYSDDPEPYGSFGNGAAMRVSACGWAGESLSEVRKLSKEVTKVSHNHPEGIKGAEAAASAVYLARTGETKEDIRKYIEEKYYKLNFTIEEIRPTYEFNETCQDTVPQAIEAFLESESFEDAIRTAVSVGGDSDTLAAITGGMAEAYYGVPKDIREKTGQFLDQRLTKILKTFEQKYPPKVTE